MSLVARRRGVKSRGVTTLAWLQLHLSKQAGARLEHEFEHFFNEEVVRRQFLKRRPFTHLLANEILREVFPFNLSRYGHDYWVKIAEDLPHLSQTIGVKRKKNAKDE